MTSSIATPTAQLDESALTTRQVVAGLCLFVAFIIEAWEMLILSYSAAHIEADLDFGDVRLGFLLSAMFFGMIPGALVWGWVIDRFGRKAPTAWSIALYGVVSAISSFSASYEMLWALRFVAGFAFSGALVAIFIYFEELLPSHVRGRATVFLAAGWPFGTLIAIGTAAMLLESVGWRSVIFASSLAGLWALAIWKWVPESPHWLENKGRTDEARTIVDFLTAGRQTPFWRKEYDGSRGLARVRTIFPAPRKPRGVVFLTVVQVVINFCISWGYWGLQTWMPTLLAERGLSLPSSYVFIALSAVMMLPGYFTAAWVTSIIGRKASFIIFIGLGAFGGLGFAQADSLVMLYVFNFVMAFFAQGAWGIWDTWFGEIYDTTFRARGYSMGISGQRIANAVAPTVIGFVVASAAGFTVTVTFIESFFVVALLAGLLLPETEGVALDAAPATARPRRSPRTGVTAGEEHA